MFPWQPACSLQRINNSNRVRRERTKRAMETRMHHHHSDDHDDMGGLHRDLAATGAVMDRRGMLRLAARFGVGAGMLQMLGCGGNTPTSPSTTSSSSTTTASGGTTNATCSAVPQETAGPYPGDGSNGPMVLNLSGVVRSDIRSSFAGLSG